MPRRADARSIGPCRRPCSCTAPAATTRCGSCRPAGLPGTAPRCSPSICRGTAARKGRRSRSIADLGGWVGRLLDAAGIETATLVAHSMGAGAALEASAALGPRIARVALLGTAAAIPVNRDLLAAAREEPQRAYQMMTAWAHGAGARLGGHPVPGLWMTGGTLALFARNAPRRAAYRSRGLRRLEIRRRRGSPGALPGPRRHRRRRHHDAAQGRAGAGPAHRRQPQRHNCRLRPHAGGGGARRRCSMR